MRGLELGKTIDVSREPREDTLGLATAATQIVKADK